MKALFIGGTGKISTAISRLVLEQGWELFLLNRGNSSSALETSGKGGKLHQINCDVRTESAEEIRAKILAAAGENGRFDVAADFIAFTKDHVIKDHAVFKDLCSQYFFISSASAYQKPPASYLITESTPLANPFWEYARNKIACEDFLMAQYRDSGFPVTIVRPSHTYDEKDTPLEVHGKNGSWQLIKRMLDGKPVIIHGDGTSLWTVTSSKDFARAFAGLMGNIHAIGETVHITSDEILTWNQIFKAVADALKVPLKAVHISSDFLSRCGLYDFTGTLIGDKAHALVFDTTKLKRLVPGFSARIRFDEGIRETLEYMLSRKECQTEDPEFDAWCDRVIAAQEKALRELGGSPL